MAEGGVYLGGGIAPKIALLSYITGQPQAVQIKGDPELAQRYLGYWNALKADVDAGKISKDDLFAHAEQLMRERMPASAAHKPAVLHLRDKLVTTLRRHHIVVPMKVERALAVEPGPGAQDHPVPVADDVLQ